MAVSDFRESFLMSPRTIVSAIPATACCAYCEPHAARRRTSDKNFDKQLENFENKTMCQKARIGFRGYRQDFRDWFQERRSTETGTSKEAMEVPGRPLRGAMLLAKGNGWERPGR